MKILVLCGSTPNEWQLEFGRILGRILHEQRCTCLVGGDTPFVQELASSGVSCLGYTIELQEETRYSTVECMDLCHGDFPKPEEAFGARVGMFLHEPDAYILVGKSEGLEGTLPHLSPLLVHNKGLEHPKPFVLVNWGFIDPGHIHALFGVPALTKEQEGQTRRDINEWFVCVLPNLPPNTSARSALLALGLTKPEPAPS